MNSINIIILLHYCRQVHTQLCILSSRFIHVSVSYSSHNTQSLFSDTAFTDWSFIHYLVVCLTTGPKPLPKRALHIVRSRAFSFKLTLRRLMSYIYIYICIYMEHPFLMFLDHTQRRSTVGRTLLDE